MIKIGPYTYHFTLRGIIPTSVHELPKRHRWTNEMKVHMYKGPVFLGIAELERIGKGNLNTTSVQLEKRHRQKGHGIFLYKGLIAIAKKLGAKRIYSDYSLNNFSRRMWDEKLPAAGFNVVTPKPCTNACKHCGKASKSFRRYIVLTK